MLHKLLRGRVLSPLDPVMWFFFFVYLKVQVESISMNKVMRPQSPQGSHINIDVRMFGM